MFLPQRVWLAALAVVMATPVLAQQAPPADQLLPVTTLAFGTLPDTPEAVAQFEKTHLGRLLADSVMDPFIEDVHEQLTARMTKGRKALPIDWADVRSSITGQTAGAVLRSSDGGTSSVVLGDVTGQVDLATKQLQNFDAGMVANGSKRAVQKIKGTDVVVHTMPKAAKEKKIQTVAYFLKDNTVVITTDVEAAAIVLGLWSAGGKDSLSADAVYVSVMARVKQDSGPLQPDAKWFVRPLPLAEAARTEATNLGRGFETDIDYLTVLKNQGFAGVQAVGGYHFFNRDSYDVSYRLAVHIPNPLTLGATVLGFPNSDVIDPQPWVPAGLSTHTTVHWDVKSGFGGIGHLVDEIVDEKGFFADLIESVALDENGPMIDIRKDLVDKLVIPNSGTRVTVISDYVLKNGQITPDSQRALVAIQANDAPGLSKNIARSFKNDPAVKVRQFKGHVIYEIHDNQPDDGDAPPEAAPPTAVCVAHGQLLVSSRVGMMENVLGMKQENPLSADPRFKLVDRELRRVAAGPVAFYAFAHTAEDVRPTYELFKAGKLREDQSVAGSLLRSILGEEGLKKNIIDGSKLPDFSVVAPYLGPTGWYLRSTESGWVGFGFTLQLEEE